MISDEEARKIAGLARLKFDENQLPQLAADLSKILEYVEKLKSVELGGIEPMSHVHGAVNVFRPDTAQPSMEAETALAGAPDSSGFFFRVPLIIE